MKSNPKSMQSVIGEDQKTCPECGSKSLERDGEETYCKKCGLVLD